MGKQWTRRFRSASTGPREKSEADIRRERIGKYFVPSPDDEDRISALHWIGRGAIGPGVAVLALLAVGLPILAGAALVLGVLIVLQGVQAWMRYWREHDGAEPCASDAEMDAYLEADLHRIASHALHQLGLDEKELELTSAQADPLGSRGPARRLAEQDSGPPVVFGPVLGLRIVGQDGIWRFGAYEVMVICPTAHHLGVFECVLETRSGHVRREEIREYYYGDIAMISLLSTTPVDLRQLDVRDTKGTVLPLITRTLLHELQVVGVSGDRSGIVAKITDQHRPSRQAVLQESGLDRVVATLRRLLREKKGMVPN